MTILLAVGLFAAAGEPNEDAKLVAFFKDYQEQRFRLEPLEATRLGEHRFDHLLDDLSPEARARGIELTRRTLARLAKDIDKAKLTRSGQIDFEILEHDLKYRLWLAEHTRPFEDDPRTYADYITDSVYLLLTQSTLPRQINLRNCSERMKQIPRVVAAARTCLRNPPKVLVERALLQNRGAISFYESGIYELAGETPQLSGLREDAQKVVKALKEHQQFLQDLLPKAGGDWRLGKVKFAQKLELSLNAGLTAPEVLREAEAEFERVTDEMYVVARQLWSDIFPGKALPPDDDAGRRTIIRLVLDQVSREHGQPADLVRDARESVAKIKDFIRDNKILTLPDPDRCQIIEMPEF